MGGGGVGIFVDKYQQKHHKFVQVQCVHWLWFLVFVPCNNNYFFLFSHGSFFFIFLN